MKFPYFYIPFELVCSIYDIKSIIIVRQSERVGFKGEQPEMPPQDLHKTEIVSTDFVEIFARQKSRKISLCFSYYKK
jgi:hypothetical protein